MSEACGATAIICPVLLYSPDRGKSNFPTQMIVAWFWNSPGCPQTALSLLCARPGPGGWQGKRAAEGLTQSKCHEMEAQGDPSPLSEFPSSVVIRTSSSRRAASSLSLLLAWLWHSAVPQSSGPQVKLWEVGHGLTVLTVCELIERIGENLFLYPEGCPALLFARS